jgi:hypothetical protein
MSRPTCYHELALQITNPEAPGGRFARLTPE